MAFVWLGGWLVDFVFETGSQTYFVEEDNLELLIFLLPDLAGIRGVCHYAQFSLEMVIEHRTSYILGEYSTN